ncbi:MAG TPA: IS30 family transposase [Candidatus Dormibacteraeota bacterium]|nr:IS30 family transposase [Candidatus Dormibacteraeota bacterium]
MSLSPRRDQQRHFWVRIRAGQLREAAGAAVGLSETTVQRWFRQAGGVIPAYVRTQSSGRHLSMAEREDIFAGVERGESIRFIAKGLGRAPSTVLRELRRNMRHQLYRGRNRIKANASGKRRSIPWIYRPSLAQLRADAKARRPKAAKLATNLLLRELVEAKLKEQLSPEQISAQLRREFPSETEMWVSHETIYQSIYVQGRGALRRELAVCLRTGRALRRPHRKGNERRGRIPGMVNISERPAEVEDRAVPGHWEGDLILGKNGKSAIGTLVERSTRFLMLLHLPHGQSALEVQEAMLAATQRLPQALWKSLTWDQGREMTRHAEISVATGLEIYFCDPAKPWQRGSNENTNGLLRQYFPKGTDLRLHGPDHLAFVSAQMNRRPRKTLGWDCPAEALDRLLSQRSSTGVASTD